jgi:hypothetical protein
MVSGFVQYVAGEATDAESELRRALERAKNEDE